jgi:hypothetical protein
MTMDTARLLYWMAERERIRLLRAAGQPAPWSNDPILRDWSFTNVRREDDRVTRWVATHWREPHSDDPDLWFAMVVAVFVNWPGTLAEIGFPVPWQPDHFRAVMADRAQRGEQLYGGAYRIHADRRYPTTAEYQIREVFNPLWRAREYLRPQAEETLSRYCSRLGERHGFGGGFMPGQVIAYLKYTPPLRDASDWMSFAVSGPGSRAGLSRIIGLPPTNDWVCRTSWRTVFDQLREAIAPDLAAIGLADLHAQDLQSCLCELNKYERVRLQQGHPRRRFRPSPEPLPGLLQQAAE